MPQIINTNVPSLTAQRNLNTSQGALAQALQRLSSGLRINSARDDAAGLAISERFTAQSLAKRNCEVYRWIDLCGGATEMIILLAVGRNASSGHQQRSRSAPWISSTRSFSLAPFWR